MAPLKGDAFLEAMARGRDDHEFFGSVFLGRAPTAAQLDFLENANATVNCLATANRWGKTTVLSHLHYHSAIYKVGAEDRYFDEFDQFDQKKFNKVKYHTIHTAGDWETASLVWEEAHKLLNESVNLAAFVKSAPRSLPPDINFVTGSKWKFRTLGHDARGIDGNSFYIVSIDEAGWIEDLATMMRNVIRVRVADVRGRIYIVGTFKPGISKDFYSECRKASARTGVGISFDHQSAEDDIEEGQSLDSSIRKYLRQYGIDLEDELRAALAEREVV